MSENLLEILQTVEFISVALFVGVLVSLPLWSSRPEARPHYYRILVISGIISIVCIYLLHFKN